MLFSYQRDVLSSIVGKILIRSVAVKCLNLHCSSIQIRRTSDGRPFLAEHSNQLDFNISHAGDFTVIVASSVYRCGVDIMRLELPPSEQSSRHFVLKMKNLFTPFEVTNILSSEHDSRQMYSFYRHWCLKESYLKALGCGLRIPLNQLECDFSNSNSPQIRSQLNHLSSRSLRFEEHTLPLSHMVTVASFGDKIEETDVSSEPFVQLNYKQLTEYLTPIYSVNEELWFIFDRKPRLPPSTRITVVNVT